MMKLTVLSALVLLVSCSGGKKDDTINGAGATFPYPIYAAWAYDYKQTSEIKLNYQSIGSGGGVKQIMSRTVEFGASDAPVEAEELNKNQLLQFPAIIGGVVPIVNLPGQESGSVKLSDKVLAEIFMEEITMWNDEQIKADNPDLNLPAEKITSVHRSDGSGTTAIFTNYLADVYPKFEEKVGKGKSVKWVGGVGAKGNEGVANYVKQLPYSIGYVEYAYAKENDLSHVQLKNKAGNYVSPTVETFKSAAEFAEWDPSTHFYLWLINAPGESSWPITGASFILMAKEKPETNKKVIQFFDWCFKNGDQTAISKTYIPLPESLKQQIRTYWQANI
ncbi:MAG: phosphate ABC transporter substrate-binding protein PstS [Calditrichaeota bacterium]|nr:phosphate ABC transporter substrate-binding protein PstS [Calditrichota bacterium]